MKGKGDEKQRKVKGDGCHRRGKKGKYMECRDTVVFISFDPPLQPHSTCLPLVHLLHIFACMCLQKWNFYSTCMHKLCQALFCLNV